MSLATSTQLGAVPDPQDKATLERSKPIELRRGRATLRADFANETVHLNAVELDA